MLSAERPTLAPALPYARPRLHATATAKLRTMASGGMDGSEGAEHDDEGAGQNEGAERGGTRAVGSALVGQRAVEAGEAHPGAAAEVEHVTGEERRHGSDRRAKAGHVRGPGRGERRGRPRRRSGRGGGVRWVAWTSEGPASTQDSRPRGSASTAS